MDFPVCFSKCAVCSCSHSRIVWILFLSVNVLMGKGGCIILLHGMWNSLCADGASDANRVIASTEGISRASAEKHWGVQAYIKAMTIMCVTRQVQVDEFIHFQKACLYFSCRLNPVCMIVNSRHMLSDIFQGAIFILTKNVQININIFLMYL